MQTPVVYRSSCCQLHWGDGFEWMKGRAARTIDAVVTDPPYAAVEYSPEELTRKADDKGIWRLPPSFDGWRRRPLPRFTDLSKADVERLRAFYERLGLCFRGILKPGAHAIIASTPVLSHLVANALASAGLERRGEIVRLTRTLRGGNRPKGAEAEFDETSVIPRGGWEPWLIFREPMEGTVAANLRQWGTGALRRPAVSRPFVDVIPSGRPTLAERAASSHPSLKPQEFLRQVVHAALPLGTGVVFDPFAGSGSTLAAASAIGYRAIGVELNHDFAKEATVAIPRLASLTPAKITGDSRRDQRKKCLRRDQVLAAS